MKCLRPLFSDSNFVLMVNAIRDTESKSDQLIFILFERKHKIFYKER
jgi:hypothetical protein